MSIEAKLGSLEEHVAELSDPAIAIGARQTVRHRPAANSLERRQQRVRIDDDVDLEIGVVEDRGHLRLADLVRGGRGRP